MKPLPGQQTLFGDGRRSALPQYDAAAPTAHQCRESTVCRCSMIGTEPNENCPAHGYGTYPPRCAECGKYMPPVPCNPSVEPDDAPRLARQRDAILARLRQGPATNLELEMIGSRFSARLGELKKARQIKGWLKRTIKAGVIEYRLIGEDE